MEIALQNKIQPSPFASELYSKPAYYYLNNHRISVAIFCFIDFL